MTDLLEFCKYTNLSSIKFLTLINTLKKNYKSEYLRNSPKEDGELKLQELYSTRKLILFNCNVLGLFIVNRR